MNKKEVIVVFDSGIGGLTVLRELKKHKINEEFVYLADSANSPYGDKTKEQIIISVLGCFKDLSKIYDFKAIVIACNTASAYTKDLLEHIYSVPVFSIIDAATDFIKELNIRETIDVLSTVLTAKSHAYKKNLPAQYVREIGCPSFVPLIESENYLDDVLRSNTVKSQLIGVATVRGKYVVLGCTHYPLLENEISDFYGTQCNIINPSKILGNNLSRVFSNKSLQFQSSYYITAMNDHFNSFASNLMHEDVKARLLSEELLGSSNYEIDIIVNRSLQRIND